MNKKAALRWTASVLLFLCAFLLSGNALGDHDHEHRVSESRSRYELGRMYEQAGDLVRAEENYSRAIELWPDNTDARLALQRVLEAKKPPEPAPGWWQSLFSWVPGFGGTLVTPWLELIGWLSLVLVTVAVVARVGVETIRLAYLKARGIPLMALGEFADPEKKLMGLPHHVASLMNDSGLTIFDEKGAIKPDFNLIVDASPFPQARLLARLLEMVITRQVQRIRVEVTTAAGGMINCAISLTDTANSYVRYLDVVTLPPDAAPTPSELTRLAARYIADTVLIDLARDPNTRGLLHQRMGDWQAALAQFRSAAEESAKKGNCGVYYQAFLNLGNLYSFLGLHEKSVEAYNRVAEAATHPVTQALIAAATACSYKWWGLSTPDQKAIYDHLARQQFDKALKSQHKSPLVHYTMACYYALAEEFEECLRWMREAVSGDLGFLGYAETDPDLENLRRWLRGRSLGEAIGLRIY